MSMRDQRIAELEQRVVNYQVMAAEFDMFMKACIFQEGDVFYLKKAYVQKAAENKQIIKITADKDTIIYTLCPPEPKKKIILPNAFNN
jgi:hypothetical protein